MLLSIVILLIVGLTACGGSEVEHDENKLRVVATTNIVADVVSQIGGEVIELTTLLPQGIDPHTFEPQPLDVVAVVEADVVFVSGFGLEDFMDSILQNVDQELRLVSVSEGVDHIALGGDAESGGIDPHVWLDPSNVRIWVSNITSVLSELDPANIGTYEANASSYLAELQELDEWIIDQVAEIPPENRLLLTDHDAFGYLAERYGFELVGALIPGYSTLSEPSAQEMVEFETAIEEYNVPAIFVSETVNSNLAQRVAEDTGIDLVFVYTGSLSIQDGPASTYLEMMRFNISAIVKALK
ncbi:MAG: zinc ABC transporter substrate-binding protein [Chloroflexi bacterium]|nr:zinc ABC transporter substrate-binding protein [Chloroflexota bacterium]